MDYIREELVRQRGAFLLLLSGGGEQQEEERRKEFRPTEKESLTQAERRKIRLPAEEQSAADLRPDVDSQTAQWLGTVREPEMFRFTALSAQKAVGVGTEAGRYRLGPRTAGIRREETAKALSRAFERDARRYDGGYPLY